MQELDHNNLEYEGAPGEKVTMEVTAKDTNHIVTYKFDIGATQVLKKGDAIEFNLKNTSGQKTELQLITDGTTPGSYDIIVENVPNCVKDLQQLGNCKRTRPVPPKKISLFVFFVA
jgi:hypothetical protein